MNIWALIALILVAAVVAGFYHLGVRSRAGAPPGLVDGALAVCPNSPNCVISESGAPTDKRVEPFPLDAWARIPAVVEQLGGDLSQQENDYIAATFTSSVFRFVDDVEFRRAEDAVHVRSASRVGHGDMGVNAKRVEALRAALAQ